VIDEGRSDRTGTGGGVKARKEKEREGKRREGKRRKEKRRKEKEREEKGWKGVPNRP